LNKLLDLQILRATKGKIVADFAVEVHSAVSSLAQCELKTELYSRSALRQVANKLSPVMREKWSEEIYKRLPEYVTLIDYDEWLTTKTKGILGHLVPRSATRPQNYTVQGRQDAASFEEQNEESTGGKIDHQSRHHQRYTQLQSTSTVQQTSSRRMKRQTHVALFRLRCRTTQD